MKYLGSLAVVLLLAACGASAKSATTTTTSSTTSTSVAPVTSSTTPRPTQTTVLSGRTLVGVGEQTNLGGVDFRLDGYHFDVCGASRGKTTLAVDFTITNQNPAGTAMYGAMSWMAYDHLGRSYDAQWSNACGTTYDRPPLSPGVTVHPQYTFEIPQDATGLVVEYIYPDKHLRFALPE